MDWTMMEAITYALDYGPWIVLCYYLIFVFQKKIGENTTVMTELLRYLKNGK